MPIPEHNIKAIRKGDTWSWSLEFYEDECEETPIDVSDYTFKLMAKNSSGTTQFTWNNADFVEGSTTNKRLVTLSDTTTATYPVGEFVYDLQVTTDSGVYTWMAGYVSVENQVTS